MDFSPINYEEEFAKYKNTLNQNTSRFGQKREGLEEGVDGEVVLLL